TPLEKANAIERGQPTAENPLISNKLSTFSELTAGGTVVKDRLWFFTAGRFEDSATQGTLPLTAIPYTKTNDSKRYEAKATGSLASGQKPQGAFIDNTVDRGHQAGLRV